MVTSQAVSQRAGGGRGCQHAPTRSSSMNWVAGVSANTAAGWGQRCLIFSMHKRQEVKGREYWLCVLVCMCPAGHAGCMHTFTWSSLFICNLYLPVCLPSCNIQCRCCMDGSCSVCVHGWLFILLLCLCPSLGGGPGLLWVVTSTCVSPSVPLQTDPCKHSPTSLQDLSYLTARSAQLLGKGFSPPAWKIDTN